MKRRKNPCPWWKGHDWHESGYDGLLTVRETCARCGLVKVFNGALDETYYIEPKPRDDGKEDETSGSPLSDQ